MPTREEHYLGNPLLKRANIEVELAPDQLLELAKCSDDPIYFAKNYIKIVTLNEGLVNFKPYSFQEEMLENFYTKRFNICKLPRQSGKALSLDTPIPTPNGWATMGDIKIGDSILDPNGNSVSVIKKTDIMYNHDCYKLYFDNGDSIVADSEHLWEVNSAYWNSGKKIISSKEIFDAYNLKKANKKGFGFAGSYYIEHSKPLNTFIHDVLPIDPYLLGLWLGDGYSDSGRIIAHKNDFYYYKQKIDVEYEREEGNCIRFKCLNLFNKLKNNNLLGNKHIPQIYLRSSYENRLNLLRGLMDTDGSVKKNSRSFEFYQKNYSLILQFVELLSSLGIKSRIRSKRLKGQIYYTVSFTTTEQVFNLQRKCNNVNANRKTRPQDKRIYLQKIEKINSVPVACLSVDSEDHLFLCGRTFIPTHNSTTTVAFLIHNMLFDEHTSIAILANKAQTAKEILSRLQTAYENLPKWMQQGVKSCNKTSMELENGSKVIAASTSASAVRGGTYSLLMLDEYAFVPEQVATNFMQSVYPTISSGNKSKIIVVSTPRGMNHFYKLWIEAKSGTNEYHPFEIHWSDVPGRDEEWKRQQIANTSQKDFDQEFNTEFLGSSETLISGSKLSNIVTTTPIRRINNLDVYEEPKAGHVYVTLVDTAQGVEKDYSAFVIIDIIKAPYPVVAKYRDNEIKPELYSDIVKKVALQYNQSFLLCEVNEIGREVAKDLIDDEYPNMLLCSTKSRSGQFVGQNFSGKYELGVKMQKNTKKVGCLKLKTLIEENILTINDYDIFSELTTFVQKGSTFEAESGRNDDLVMCLVMFSWLTTNQYFKDIIDIDLRQRLLAEKKDKEEEDVLPFGFAPFSEDVIVDEKTGDMWQVVEDEEMNTLLNLFNYY